MRAYKPGWEPSKSKSGGGRKGKKKAAESESEGSDSAGSESSDEDAIRPSAVSDRPKRQTQHTRPPLLSAWNLC